MSSAVAQVGGPGPLPPVLEVAELGRYWHVTFRKSSRFAELKVPSWAAAPAARYCKGAKVRTGRLTSSGAWVVQAVLIPVAFSRSTADVADVAWRIMARIEG